jgi:hypothetical protein
MEDIMFEIDGACSNKDRLHSGERALLASIIGMAFKDVITPPPSRLLNKPPKYYRSGKRAGQLNINPLVEAYQSAIEFLKADNKIFQEYCFLLDVDPEYAERKIWKKIQYIRDNPSERKKFKELPQ